MSKNKISPDEKSCAVKLFLDGKVSQRSIADHGSPEEFINTDDNPPNT